MNQSGNNHRQKLWVWIIGWLGALLAGLAQAADLTPQSDTLPVAVKQHLVHFDEHQATLRPVEMNAAVVMAQRVEEHRLAAFYFMAYQLLSAVEQQVFALDVNDEAGIRENLMPLVKIRKQLQHLPQFKGAEALKLSTEVYFDLRQTIIKHPEVLAQALAWLRDWQPDFASMPEPMIKHRRIMSVLQAEQLFAERKMDVLSNMENHHKLLQLPTYQAAKLELLQLERQQQANMGSLDAALSQQMFTLKRTIEDIELQQLTFYEINWGYWF